MDSLNESILKDLKSVSNLQQSKGSERFFKTGKGEYGEGDIFVGITAPDMKKMCKKYFEILPIKNLDFFFTNNIHEYRSFAFGILLCKWKKANIKEREQIYREYIKYIDYANNWDLVDMSAPTLMGEYLLDKNRDILYDFARSNKLWNQRIAIVSTYTFIRNKEYKDTLEISKLLLNHKHDLIHKAVGWMLREVGKRDLEVEENFLKQYYQKMPRTMLRYAIEKFDEDKRQEYLKG